MRKLTYSLIVLFFLSSFDISVAQSNSKYCKIIAFVLSSEDKSYYPGQKICAGQNIPSFSQIIIACTDKNNRFLVRDKKQLKECESDSVFPTHSSDDTRARNDNSTSIRLLFPTNQYIINQGSIQLFWFPIKNAKKYTIKILDENESKPNYVTKDNKISISLPQNLQTLNIIIRSFSETRQMSSNIFSFNILPKNKDNLIYEYINNVDLLKLDKKEKIDLKLAVYGEYNLLKPSLSLLDSSIKNDSTIFEYYIIIGDLYFRSGMIDSAQQSYSQSRYFALKSKNLAAGKIAESRLDLVREYNLVKVFNEKT
jgi:hypothetical protein